jgi:hypothetical protein
MTNLDDFLLDDRVFPLPSEAEVRIDADRLVYDLEYRDDVRALIKAWRLEAATAES